MVLVAVRWNTQSAKVEEVFVQSLSCANLAFLWIVIVSSCHFSLSDSCRNSTWISDTRTCQCLHNLQLIKQTKTWESIEDKTKEDYDMRKFQFTNFACFESLFMYDIYVLVDHCHSILLNLLWALFPRKLPKSSCPMPMDSVHCSFCLLRVEFLLRLYLAFTSIVELSQIWNDTTWTFSL